MPRRSVSAAVDGVLTCGEGQRLVVDGQRRRRSRARSPPPCRRAIPRRMSPRWRSSRALTRSEEARLGELGHEGSARLGLHVGERNTSVALRIPEQRRVATAIAEYFRDRGLRVLLLMDSAARVCMAQRELGLATFRTTPTTRVIRPPAWPSPPPRRARRTRREQRSITGIIRHFWTIDLGDPIGARHQGRHADTSSCRGSSRIKSS